MEYVKIECPAKINLSLDVLGRRSDGYHDLKMIMQTIDLCDEIHMEKTDGDKGIIVTCDHRNVPENEANICYKAAKKLFDIYALEGGLTIQIKKRIPVEAGLAGGSADAAGVIKGMNSLYGLGMDDAAMRLLGLSLGADVPFCLLGGTALAEGVGEILTPLPPFDAWCVVAKPDVSVSTASVFKEYRGDEVKHHPDTDLLIESIKNGRLSETAEYMVNVLESVTIKRHEVICQIKNIMLEFGALGSLMSGSGPTVFGIFDDRATAEKCCHRLEDYLKEVYLVKTLNH